MTKSPDRRCAPGGWRVASRNGAPDTSLATGGIDVYKRPVLLIRHANTPSPHQSEGGESVIQASQVWSSGDPCTQQSNMRILAANCAAPSS